MSVFTFSSGSHCSFLFWIVTCLQCLVFSLTVLDCDYLCHVIQLLTSPNCPLVYKLSKEGKDICVWSAIYLFSQCFLVINSAVAGQMKVSEALELVLKNSSLLEAFQQSSLVTSGQKYEKPLESTK